MRVALVIGNADYDGNGVFDKMPKPGFVSDLRNPCKDAKLIRDALTDAKFNSVDFACDLRKEQFEKKLDDFGELTKRLPSGSLAVLYYSGHGNQQHGYTYSTPVMFPLPDFSKLKGDNAVIQYFHSHALNIQWLLGKLTKRPDIGILVALDQCRDQPISSEIAFNEAVKVTHAENILIQYAASAGDRTADGPGSNSEYALLLNEELRRGGQLFDVISRVWSRIEKLYQQGSRRTSAPPDTGIEIQRLRSPALVFATTSAPSAQKPADRSPSGVAASAPDKLSRSKKTLRGYHGNLPSLDILWCEGRGDEARLASAYKFAHRVVEAADRLGIGRVQVKPLSVDINLNENYNVWRNLARYDQRSPTERILLNKIAAEFPDMGIIPRRGVGVAKKPTNTYVSVFICNGFEGK